MAIGLATGVGGAAVALTCGASLLAGFLAYSLCGALGVLVSGLTQARVVHGPEKPAPRDTAVARDMARSLG